MTFIHENRTPNGNPVRLEVREGTNDQNVSHSVTKLDEYGLAGLDLSGWAIDIGANIGAVAIPLALDHSRLHVVAVEPVPENYKVLHRNIELNGVSDRVRVLPMAAAAPGGEPVAITYGGEGQYRFVGNVGAEAPDADVVIEVPGISLAGLLDAYSIERVSLLKSDSEGAEWQLFQDEAVSRCDLIVGEFHDSTQAQGAERIHALLDRTHEVTINRWVFKAAVR